MSVSLLRCSCTRRGGSGTVAEPTLYLFDGHNLFHAGDYKDLRQLRDELASFVALKGARGYLVFDGSGADESYGPLEGRYAKNADTRLERLAAGNGFSTKAAAPSPRACSRISGEVRAVMTTIGICASASNSLTRLITTKPSPPGKRMSRRISTGCSLRITLNAETASLANAGS